jgi:hypothetical protein
MRKTLRGRRTILTGLQRFNAALRAISAPRRA